MNRGGLPSRRALRARDAAGRPCARVHGCVFGSGTPFGGCMLDHGGPWLEPGDVVELEVHGIGVLTNTIG